MIEFDYSQFFAKIEERERLRMFWAKMSTTMPTSRSAKVEKLRLIRLKSI